MAKTDTQTAVRPPRPARRVRLEAGESGSSSRVQPTAASSGSEPDLIEPDLIEDLLEPALIQPALIQPALIQPALIQPFGAELEGAPSGQAPSGRAPSVQSGPQRLRRAGNGGGEPPVPFNFFEPRGAIRPRTAELMYGLPLAALEGPSTAQLDLTPSPVPRVSLVPATGVVDISLVPGPNAPGSRNLPTLAARHALGRPRERGAAPALTFPPSGLAQQRAGAAPKRPRQVRSSQREVVLGLGIGVGLSILLAVAGQALLHKGGSANSEPALQTATPSLSPSATPDGERLLPAPAAGFAGTAPSSGVDSAGAPASASAPAPAAAERVPSDRATSERAASDRAVAQVATRRRSAARARSGSSRLPSAASAAPSEERSPDGPEPPSKTPLSPSESAGLGLDLSL
jgi:hypothetical protein